MFLARRLLGFSLALLLAMTSQALAVARGEAPAAGFAVYCMGGTMVTVAIDADGQPVSAPHLCPDAASGFALLGEAPARALPPHVAVAAIAWREPALGAPVALVPVPQARGPPLLS